MEGCSNDLSKSSSDEKATGGNSNDDQKYMMERSCSNCNDANVDLFTCGCCVIDEKPEENGATPKYYCSCCIIRCTKAGHKIRNLKGQEPLVCSDHKIVKSEYCQTCDHPLCFKCLASHFTHEPGSLELKACNRKRKIFEFLSEMETAEKPLRKN